MGRIRRTTTPGNDATRRLGPALIVALAVTVTLFAGCSVTDDLFRPPLPPPETLELQPIFIPGGSMSGDTLVRIAWNPPDEDAEVELVVIEQADSEGGPWMEVGSRSAARGFHEESGVFRAGRFYYFRALLTRGDAETPPGPAVSVWIPPTSRATAVGTPPVVAPAPTVTPADITPVGPFPIPTATVIPTPTATWAPAPTSTPTPVP